MERPQYDIVTIGGGVAGAALAGAMARAGARVLVLERSQRFDDRVRGEWLAPWGVHEARELGLLDDLDDDLFHPLPTLVGRSGKGRPVESPDGEVPRTFFHPDLQEALLKRAHEAGAEVVRGARVTGIADGALPSVTFEHGERSTVTTRIVVGADGRSSMVRPLLGREPHVQRSERLLAGVRLGGVAGDPEVGYFIVREDADALVSLFPQGDGYARAYIFRQGDTQGTYRGKGGAQQFIQAMISLGVPEDVLAGAWPAGPLAAFMTEDSWVEHPASDSLALIGDAAGVSDPTWGMGLSLALRDARALAEQLTESDDWAAALDRYARQRDEYFRTVITAEAWQTELQLTPGVAADIRRRHAMKLWSKEPGRAVDLPGLGPSVSVTEEARIRFFGEDIAMAEDQAPDALTVGRRFVDALGGRDFRKLGELLGRSMRMRALLPGGSREFHESTAAVEAFTGWFAPARTLSVISSEIEHLADRLHLGWRFEVQWPDEETPRLVEQHAYAKVAGGQIVVLDLLCSGFRPVPQVVSIEAA